MCRRRQSGFGVIAAIFILVILAGLASFMVSLSASQHAGAALDVTGARVYQAARSGTEWGIYRASTGNCAATTNIGLVDGVAVTVACVETVAAPAAEPGFGHLFQITSTACNLPSGTTCPGDATAVSSPNYVERRLTALAEY